MICTEDMQTSRRAHQIVKLKERRQQNAAKARDGDKRLADRLRQLQAEEAKRERKRETRRKIVIGAIVRAAQMSETEISLRWLEAKIHALERPDDRALFGLDPGAVRRSRGRGHESEPAGAPITSRQKKLLAQLVEEHPQFARELGVNPDEPGLESAGQGEGGFADPGVARPGQAAGAGRPAMTTRAAGGAQPPTLARRPVLVRAVTAEPVTRGVRNCRSWGTKQSPGGAQARRAVARGQARSATAGCPRACRRAGELFMARSGLVAGGFRSPGQELRQLLHVLHLL